MPLQLLPASAQAFAPRAAPNIVLNTKVEPWLTQTLKRINKIKRPLNSVPQHFRCLTDTLGGENAIWSLAALMLPKAPDTDLRKDSNPLVEALFNYQLIHIEAYVVHVDMVSQHEVAFKLTADTIDLLVEYHKDIYTVDVSANTCSWPEKEAQVKKMQEEFVQAANRYVFRTNVRALEGLEEDGAGELLDGRSNEVKTAVMNMFQPLLPPPPRIVDVIHPAPILPNQTTTVTYAGHWWPSATSQQHLATPLPAPVDAWKVLPSTPSPTATTCSDNTPTTFWPELQLPAAQLPSPTPSFSQPVTFTSAPSQYFSSPECIASIPTLSLTNTVLQNCGSDFSMSPFGDLGNWNSIFFQPQYAAIM